MYDTSVPVRTELTFRLPNSPGALSRVLTALSGDHVSVTALALESTGRARVVADMPERAAGILDQLHVRAERRDVLVTAVAARSVAARLSSVADAGINIEYAYMSPVENAAGGDTLITLVIGVEDAVRAAAAAGI